MKSGGILWVLLMTTALMAGWPIAAYGGWSGFLFLNGVAGESQDTNHDGWLDVQSVAAGSLLNISGTNNPVGGALCFQKNVDRASPALALDCAKGVKINYGVLDLTATNASQIEFFRLNLTNVFVTSLEHFGSTSSGEPRPPEELCLSAAVVSWNYTYFNPSSGLPRNYSSSYWDFAGRVGGGGTNAPVFMMTGIRNYNGVQLNWNASTGKQYRIYATHDLKTPFVAWDQVTAGAPMRVVNWK